MTRQHRDQVILSMLDPSGRGLEIGASHSPMFPKAGGFRVETVDHLPSEELRRKYRDMGVDTSRIEEVDHVWRGEPLDELVRARGAYDFIFASHVLEHLPDPLSFLNACDSLLCERGVLVVAVPDKRFCFDAFLPLASAGDLLQAHLERRKRHPPGTLFDHAAYRAERRGQDAWRQRTLGPIELAGTTDEARREAERAASSAEYLDTHGWQFVPSSFRLALRDLHAAGLTPMREVAFSDPRGQRHEFFVSMARRGPGCPVDRATLCRRVLREQRAGVDDIWTSALGLLSALWAAGRRLLRLDPW